MEKIYDNTGNDDNIDETCAVPLNSQSADQDLLCGDLLNQLALSQESDKEGAVMNLTQASQETKSFNGFKAAAEQGSASAQFKLGECFEFGRGVDTDYEAAVFWYRKGISNQSISTLFIYSISPTDD